LRSVFTYRYDLLASSFTWNGVCLTSIFCYENPRVTFDTSEIR
jgi:hypothetical protein